jgi:hypothetical protein
MSVVVRINQRRLKALVTVTAGTPIFVANTQTLVDSVMVIMMQNGSGVGRVYDDVAPGTLPANVAANETPVPLAPATASAPGGTVLYTAPANGSLDLQSFAFDGSVTGDTILVDAHLKI